MSEIQPRQTPCSDCGELITEVLDNSSGVTRGKCGCAWWRVYWYEFGWDWVWDCDLVDNTAQKD